MSAQWEDGSKSGAKYYTEEAKGCPGHHEESADDTDSAAKGGQKGGKGGKWGKGKGGGKGWTYAPPQSRPNGWISVCNMAHDRFSNRPTRRYDFFAACHDGCKRCVHQMLSVGYVSGQERSDNMGYTGLDFAVYARKKRRVETKALEECLRSAGVVERKDAESD